MNVFKKIFFFATTIIILATTFACNDQNKPNIDAQTFEIVLTSENQPTNLTVGESSPISHVINGIEFNYANAFADKDDDSHVNLNKGGSITNSTPLGDLRSVTVNYDFVNPLETALQNQYGFGYLKYRIGNNYVDNPNDYGTLITSVGKDYVIDLKEREDDYFISFWTPRTVKINKLVFKYAKADYKTSNSDFTIQIISTNDLHGQVSKTDDYPGLASLTTKMQELAGAGDQFNLFIDQGDLYQGTAETGLSNGYNMDDFLLINGYESTTLGNHEFDWGESRIKEHVDYSSTTVLANNIRYKDTNLSPDWTTPYKLVSRNGVKIGIIGAVGDVESSISASKIENLDILTGYDLTQQIIKDSNALKDLGADFIILSLHDGDTKKKNNVATLPYYDVNLLSKNYVDLVLEGHSHQSYAFYDYKGVWHLQNRGNGASFYLAKLNCEYKNGDYSVTLSTTKDTPYYYSATSSKEDTVIKEMDAWYKDNVYGKIQSEVIGYDVPYMYSSTFESLCSKLYYQYGTEKTQNSEYEIILGGGFIRTRTPYDLQGGTVVYGDVFNLLPFDNDLVLCSLLGVDLKNKFIETQNQDYFVYPTIDPSSISDTQIYYILTDSYTSDYAYNNLTVIKNYTLTDHKYARDLVSDHFKLTYL